MHEEQGEWEGMKELNKLDCILGFLHKIVISMCFWNNSCSPGLSQMNDNQIENWADLDELQNAKHLETVYLERNPLQKDPQYRRKIMLALPSVRQIDATFIRF